MWFIIMGLLHYQLNIDEFMPAGGWLSINVRIPLLHLWILVEDLFLKKYKVGKFVHISVWRNKDFKYHMQDYLLTAKWI